MLRPLVLIALYGLLAAPAHSSAAAAAVESALCCTGNRVSESPPVIVAPIEDIDRRLSSTPIEIDLNRVFDDPNGNPLSFSVRPQTTDIASFTIDGAILTIFPENIGSEEIRVIATDTKKRRTRDVFLLTFRGNALPFLSSQAKFVDRELESSQAAYRVALLDAFVDPDGDPLVYSVESTDPSVTSPFILNDQLVVPALAPGTSIVTVSADDQNGGIARASFRITVVPVYPAKMLVQVDRRFGDPDLPESYRMVALPGNQRLMIDALVEGFPHADWEAYAADSLTGNLSAYDGTERFAFRPGSGMWFIARVPWALPYRNVPTVPLAADGTYTIPLHEGWNIISNPFDIDIPWGDVVRRNGNSQSLWRWAGTYERADTLYSAQKNVEAFYFFNAERFDSLALPHPFFSSFPGARKTTHDLDARLSISIQAEEGPSASAVVSFGPAASEGLDSYDQYAPPGDFSTVNIVLSNRHTDFQGRHLIEDSRPSSDDFARFDLTLIAQNAPYVEVALSGIDQVRAESIVFVDLRNTRRLSLTSRHRTHIHMDAPEIPVALLIGSRSDVERHASDLKPQITSLLPNYPNPFQTHTTFEFTLNRQEHVNFSIFDAMGRRMVTVYEGEKQAGLHRLSWQGHDQAGRSLANGVYFYRLQTPSSVLTKKLILLR